MNPIFRQNSLITINNFVQSLNKLAQNKNNQYLDEAINSWCRELSIDGDFPQASTAIIENKNQWLQDSRILSQALQLYRNLLVITDKRITKIGLGNINKNLEKVSRKDFYNNIKETKEDMSVKSIVLIAFIFTGIGLLLFLLNKKENKNKFQYNNQPNNNSGDRYLVKEQYVLALLIKSDRYQDLIYSLKNNSYLQPEDSSKLYGATQGLWIGAKSKFNQSQIKRELDRCNPVSTTSEYDVHFVTITLDKDDFRFRPNVNPMDRRDAFIELGNKPVHITVSRRLSCKAYENTEFYNR